MLEVFGDGEMIAPFIWFGGKRTIAADVWSRFGPVNHYIEPFCGSAAILLAAPRIAQLEVVCDTNGFVANFWRAVKYQPAKVAEWADYPVSHIDIGARHRWLMDPERRAALETTLQDADWPGDAKVAGWWLWGQCAWIGSGWCEWERSGNIASDQIPHISDAGVGIRAIGRIPHITDAGRGIQAIGKIPHISHAGRGMLTSSGRTAMVWLNKLAGRLERVRVLHGDWSRCLNSHYEHDSTAVFLDPPYRGYEVVYDGGVPVIDTVVQWARYNADLRIALCGHAGDYDLPGWDAVPWKRASNTYGSDKTADQECVWYSPACLPRVTRDLFAEIATS